MHAHVADDSGGSTRVGYAGIELNGLSLAFRRKGTANHVIQDLSLTISPGEFVVIVGRSGCGKTTLLRIAAGLLRPSAGIVKIAGQPVVAPRHDIGIAFQRPTLLPWKRVLQNVLLPFDAGVVGRRQSTEQREASKAYARELLTMVGLEDYLDAYPAELSGGMQQRVAICRSLVTRPSALLMDEPFAALDAINREVLAFELGKLCAAVGVTVMFITHSISEALFLADRVVVMQPGGGHIGAVVRVPSPRPRSISAFSDASTAELAQELREAIEGNDLPLTTENQTNSYSDAQK